MGDEPVSIRLTDHRYFNLTQALKSELPREYAPPLSGVI
jgi:hypothetical protein